MNVAVALGLIFLGGGGVGFEVVRIVRNGKGGAGRGGCNVVFVGSGKWGRRRKKI